MEELIHRLLDGNTLSETESRELLDWLRASDEHRRTFMRIYRDWGEAHSNASRYDAERAYRRFTASIATTEAETETETKTGTEAKTEIETETETKVKGETRPLPRIPLRSIGVRIAAAAAILIAIYASWFRNYDSPQIDIETFTQQAAPPDFTRENVELHLPGGAKIILSEKNPAITYDGSCVRIDCRKEAFSAVTGDTPFNQLLVPFGRQSHLTLSDGTRIWVNAGSKLIYPTLFNGDTREIHVEGEVYMEVAHDPSHPFIVHSQEMDVRVLGTKFYLSSYGPKDTREVVLLSGAVSVAPTLAPQCETQIAPNQQAILGQNGCIDVRKVSARNFISWIDGYISCDNEPLGNILERIARHYDCRIDSTTEVADLPISGKLELQTDVNDVLSILSLTAPISVRKSGDGHFSVSLAE